MQQTHNKTLHFDLTRAIFVIVSGGPRWRRTRPFMFCFVFFLQADISLKRYCPWKIWPFYIDDNTDQEPKIHDGLTETVCTENTSAERKRTLFYHTQCNQVGVKRTNATLGCSVVWLLFKYVDEVQACSRVTKHRWDGRRIWQDCSALRSTISLHWLFQTSNSVLFFFSDTLDGFKHLDQRWAII